MLEKDFIIKQIISVPKIFLAPIEIEVKATFLRGLGVLKLAQIRIFLKKDFFAGSLKEGSFLSWCS